MSKYRYREVKNYIHNELKLTKEDIKEIMIPIHPNQKPVALLEYLIRTYTNEGEIILDNCIGSGTNRNFIGFEKEREYYNIACRRLSDCIKTE